MLPHYKKKFDILAQVIILFLCVFCLTGCGSAPVSDSQTPETSPEESDDLQYLLPLGSQAPDFSVATPDGQTLSLSDFKGKQPVFVEFLATWCGYCKRSVPAINELRQAIPESQMAMIGINIGDDRVGYSTTKAFVEEYRIPFPMGEVSWNSDIPWNYQVEGVPTFYLIDTDGKIVWRHNSGFRNHDRDAVKKLLQNK